MAQYDELTGLLRELLTNKFSPKPRYINGLLGDGLGNVVVPNRPDKVYARFSKESTTYFEIFNVTVPKVNNWPVKIGELPWNPGLTQVVGTNWSAFEQAGWGDVLGSTSPHAPTHEWPDFAPGSDVVSVFTRAIVPGRAFVTPGAPTTIYVNSFEYGTTGTLWPGLPGVDLQPVMSATVTGTMRYAGVYVDEDTNSLGVVTGGTTVYTSALEPPRVSFPATDAIPIARVRVYGGQAGLAEADIKDARRLWGAGGGDGGDGTGAWPADGKAMINTTEYATITLALAAASSGDVIKVGGGTFTENITIPGGVSVVGTSQRRTILSGTVTFSGNNASTERFTVNATGNAISQAVGGSTNYVFECHLAGSDNDIYVTDGSLTVAFSEMQQVGGEFGTNYGLHTNGAAAIIRAYYCIVFGAVLNAYAEAGTIYSFGSQITTYSGDVRGVIFTSIGNIRMPLDAVITMDELTSAPSTPATNNWSLYFKTDGLYHRDDTGAEVGPLGTGGGGAPADAQYVTLATDATLTNERVLTAGSGISLVDAGAGNAVTLATTAEKNANPIINGAFQVWQRGTSFAAVANGTYTADRWGYGKTGAMVHTISRSTDVPTVAQAGVLAPYSLLIDCTTVDSSIAAGDHCLLLTRIEGYNFANLAQRQFTLSFWVKATKTGIHCVSFSNAGGDRSYVAEYTINTTATWEYKTITVSASPAAGTWDYTNGRGLQVAFALAAGSTFQTTADTWQTGNYFATANQVNATDNTANDFRLALIDITPGPVAAVPVVPDIHQETFRCYRYCWVFAPGATTVGMPGAGFNVATNVSQWYMSFNPPMRATPAKFVSADTDFQLRHAGGATALTSFDADFGTSPISYGLTCVVASGLTTGQASILRSNNANAVIGFNAEL